MVIAAVPALAFNTRRKLRAGIVGRHMSPPHQYWEANIAFYATAGVTVLLLHNWVSILAPGLEVGDHQGFIKWAVVNTVLPLTFGATGYATWRGAAARRDE